MERVDVRAIAKENKRNRKTKPDRRREPPHIESDPAKQLETDGQSEPEPTWPFRVSHQPIPKPEPATIIIKLVCY